MVTIFIFLDVAKTFDDALVYKMPRIGYSSSTVYIAESENRKLRVTLGLEYSSIGNWKLEEYPKELC